MKKVIYAVALVAAFGLASCGGNKNKEAAPVEATETTETTEVAVATEEAPTCCAEGEECTNEECNKEGECTGECKEAPAEEAPATEAEPNA